MGVYDRDWWKERYNQRTSGARPPTRQSATTPPDVPGANWHWSIKLLAAGWIFLALFIIGKLAMGLPL